MAALPAIRAGGIKKMSLKQIIVKTATAIGAV